MVVNPHARHFEFVVFAVGQAHDHFGVVFFLSLGSAVFAVLRNVKNRTLFLLKAEGFEDHLFVAREVLAARDYGKFFFARK